MTNKFHLFTFSFLLLILVSCSKDDDSSHTADQFVVAFENPSLSFSAEETEKEIHLVFSEKAPQDGTLTLTYQVNDLVYGTHFSTVPTVEQGVLNIPIEAGTTGTSFRVQKLSAEGSGNGKSIAFSISTVSIPGGLTQGNKSIQISFEETASLGGSMMAGVGGPNEPNQVFVDLSKLEQTASSRDQWDLAFYAGDQFRVKLNSGMYMMAAELPSTNIDEITEASVEDLQPQMAFLVEGSDAYVDDPSGDILGTAIAEISASEENNKVYLINMGSEVGTETPETGSVAIAGEARGWKKVRILQQAGNYVLQYADLNATTHQEVSIPKDQNFNFTFFSLTQGNIVSVEPQKSNWDLNFTVNTEVLDLPEGGQSAYGFSDYVVTNNLSGVKAYQVMSSEISYQDFTSEDIITNSFELDQRAIGANWRDVFDGLFSDRFYVIEDTEGNQYKLKFTALVSPEGIRGNPEFKYKLLN